MPIVALNGVDRSGKSLQAAMLQDAGAVLLPRCGDALPRHNTPEEGFWWWFREAPLEALMDCFIKTLRFSHDRAPKSGDRISVLDRGTRMYMAVCVSICMMRTGMDVQEARALVDPYFEAHWGKKEDLEIWLIPGELYSQQIARYVKYVRPGRDGVYTAEQDELYARYQKILSEVAQVYAADLPEGHRIPVDRPACEVQDQVRAVIRQGLDASLPNVLGRWRRIVGFSGLSESGKSSYADALRRDHGVCRLKLGYPRDVIQRIGGEREPSDLQIVLEILRYLRHHYYIGVASVESIHGSPLAALMQLLLGSRYVLVYMDAPLEKRVERAGLQLGITPREARKTVEAKDRQKRASGADLIRDFADVVWLNEGPFRPDELWEAIEAACP